MKLFEQIEVCNDFTPHSAAMNMAIDEALLESARFLDSVLSMAVPCSIIWIF
jgi:hypothetical protein